MVAVERWLETALNCSAICLPCTAICLPCSLTTASRSTRGSSFSSSRYTDLTARLTNTAMKIIDTAITKNDRATTTITQNIGSLGLICSARDDISHFQFPIFNFRFKSFQPKSEIGNRNSAILVRFLLVSRRCLNPAGQFGLPLLFLVCFFSRVDRGSNSTGLSSCSLAGSPGHFTNFVGGCRIEFGSTFTRGFVILTGSFAELLCGLARTVNAFARRVCKIAAKFLT